MLRLQAFVLPSELVGGVLLKMCKVQSASPSSSLLYQVCFSTERSLE